MIAGINEDDSEAVGVFAIAIPTTSCCSMTEGSGLFFVIVVEVVVDVVSGDDDDAADLIAGTVIPTVGSFDSVFFFFVDVTIVGISFVTIVSSTGREAAACG